MATLETAVAQAPTIAVVDDEKIIVDLLAQVLGDSGYEIVTFSEPLPCLAALREGTHIDVIFSDINMPNATGIDLLRAVKELSPDIEVILMTADAQVESAVEATRFGALNYLNKPFHDINAVTAIAAKAMQRIEARRREQQALSEHAAQYTKGFRFAGRLEEISLPEVLQVVSVLERDGVVHIEGDCSGRIFARGGQIVHVEMDRLPGLKALYRMVRQQTGSYRLKAYSPPPAGETMTSPIASAMLEAVRRKDEFETLALQIPGMGSPFCLVPGCTVTIGEISPWLLEVLGDIVRCATPAATLDSSRYYDLDTLKGLITLWQLGVVGPMPVAPGIG